MLRRVLPVLALILLALAAFAPAEEQGYGQPRKHAWEFSPFMGGMVLDDDLEIDDAFILGARVGWNWTRHFETELGVTWAPETTWSAGGSNQVELFGWDLNLTANFPQRQCQECQNFGRWINWDRWIPYVTAGVGQMDLDLNTNRWNKTFETYNFGAGTRIMMGPVAGIRFDVRSRSFWKENLDHYEASLGATFIMGGRIPKDSDGDTVRDDCDRCPETPVGCWVDEFGCEKDTDGDGVCDGVDQCPDTPLGCRVDARGCPLDGDGDTVCDGLDNCPATPRGCWVDIVGCEKDSDEDGVCDGIDQCPNTKKGCRVDAKGCPLDEDGDTVCDGIDQCPGTPAGAPVDEKGCPFAKLVLADVNFEFDKDVIRDFFYPFLDEVARSMQEKVFLSLVLELAGHTDNIGSNHYNFSLGEKRAQSVKAYLVSKGVDPGRITTTSYGETRPVASNETETGRWANRRVIMEPHAPDLQQGDVERYTIVLQDALFQTGKSALSPEAFDFLDQIASALQKERFRGMTLLLQGHAFGEGKKAKAEALSVERAQAVKEYLVAKGIDPGRIYTEGLGSDRPKKGPESDARHQRRVEVHSGSR